MKETLKDIGGALLDVALTVILAILAIHALLVVLASTAMADEVLSYDERIVALTILGEARGEGKLGMYAVGCVIQQRSCNRKLTPAQVCKQNRQFSIWNSDKRNPSGYLVQKDERELYYLWKSPATPYARELARHICKGLSMDQKVTGNADHYCTLKVQNEWTKKSKPVKVIGNHKFFKLR